MEPAIESASIEEIARITGASARTIRRWKSGTSTPPESALRLLKLCLDGYNWEGCILKDGLLYFPEWRRGFKPEEIRAMFFQVQQVQGLRREAEQLKKELSRRSDEVDALETKSDFYRRQVSLESRFGMILSRIFA